MTTARLEYRIAREPWELEQIHRLNYATFTEEIPQHEPNATRMRVDKFHEGNTYIVCAAGTRIVGMVALRRERPFSVETKIENFDSYIPAGRRMVEIRLLAVEPEHRNSRVLAGLVRELWSVGTAAGYDAAVISATTRQLRLYEHLGFVPFGPRVGTGEAPFQPMLLTAESHLRVAGRIHGIAPEKEATEKSSFLPGPVTVHRDVAAAFAEAPVSHRSAGFHASMEGAREGLARLTGARHVEILLGSGTFANDAVAARIAMWREPGLILANGEFGERLVDHARRFGLEFEMLEAEWGEPIDPARVQRALDASRARWVWMTACETSTGVLNDWEAAARMCRQRGARICLDAVSAVGCVPIDLEEIDLATAVSGKGLGAYSGLAIVFHREPLSSGGAVPRSLDLGLYAENGSTPFTHSSNLMRALRVALERHDWAARFRERAALGAWMRAGLVSIGLDLVGRGTTPAPQVITIALGSAYDSAAVAAALAERGFLVAWESGYLRRRNWMQVGLMGEVTRQGAAVLVRTLRKTLDSKAER